MKKRWILLTALMMAIGLTACSGQKEAEPEKKETEEAGKEAASNPKKAMYKFYMSLVNGINEADADLNAYLSEEQPTAEMKTAASESASAVASKVESLEIPTELKDQKADLEAALKDIAGSYKAKAEELKKDTPSMEAADATFTQGEEKLGTAFESIDMKKPSLAKEVN
ncbi:hypothetical protein [Bacillus sp. REN3]|uniref:hypothetical protein n=1 Tax=Bacillus sp. REN3 TaxID=2802440 RepID=UPI001AEEE090|nr:hypothetical protein [Bacillus sp. REN3]